MKSNYQEFIFKGYSFDVESLTAKFLYSFDNKLDFEEVVQFESAETGYDETMLNEALRLAHLVLGVSYYKAFPVNDVSFKQYTLDAWQSDFMNSVYGDGLGQFIYENKLDPKRLVRFSAASETTIPNPTTVQGNGIISLQSGGKDSLLLASMLEELNVTFTPWYSTSSAKYPAILDELSSPLRTIKRAIDHDGLSAAKEQGGLNGHVPVTYILTSLAMVDSVLSKKDSVLIAVGNEGREPDVVYKGLEVRHQWSKTWFAEKLFAEYAHRYIGPDFKVGSPLRGLSELRIAELFVEKCWKRFGHDFSSCNRANYAQGHDNNELKWCGDCPKCANSYLLFAPFVEPEVLMSLFSNQNLLTKESLKSDFLGLFGINGAQKPFECVGSTEELRVAYHMARERWGSVYDLEYEVPYSDFDYKKIGECQPWAKELIRL